MTVAEFITDVRRRLNDSVSESFSDEELLAYLQDCVDVLTHKLAIRRCPLVMKSVDITSSPTSLPSDFLGVYKLVDENGDDIARITPEDSVGYDDDDTVYYILGTNLYVIPSVPSTCKLFYFYRSTVSESGDVPFAEWIAPTLKQMVAKMAFMRIEASTPDETALADLFSETAIRLMNYAVGKPSAMGIGDGISDY